MQDLLKDIKERILVIARAENQRKRRKKNDWLRDHFTIILMLLLKSCSLRTANSTYHRGNSRTTWGWRILMLGKMFQSLQWMTFLCLKIQRPCLMTKLREIQEFVRKSCAGSAPGISYNLCKNCSNVLKQHHLPPAGIETRYCGTGMVLRGWHLDT